MVSETILPHLKNTKSPKRISAVTPFVFRVKAADLYLLVDILYYLSKDLKTDIFSVFKKQKLSELKR